jgi:sulfatase maturation enzyme AslB (radical SAM superfamily)
LGGKKNGGNNGDDYFIRDQTSNLINDNYQNILMRTKATIKGLVLKVARRCNLNCEYCYMYNLGDETYKSQPKFMS